MCFHFFYRRLSVCTAVSDAPHISEIHGAFRKAFFFFPFKKLDLHGSTQRKDPPLGSRYGGGKISTTGCQSKANKAFTREKEDYERSTVLRNTQELQGPFGHHVWSAATPGHHGPMKVKKASHTSTELQATKHSRSLT